ncbi:alkaline phosphatase family protein [Pendulispora albinea]|uniref:Alkaline phosphatase family protein n=1 Tax=Pendulispora albinea TaxID=2741071 RepID=A0ABZ2LZN2_9BACT
MGRPSRWTFTLAQFLTPAALAFTCGCGGGAANRPPADTEVRAATPNDAGATPSAPASARRVVVSIVVDQFAAWIASERLPLLPESGGFARLRREGTWVKQLRYAHAVTDTAPGHSALYTGATPRESGIFSNETADASGARISILTDASSRIVAGDGPGKSPSSSSARLKVDTVADAFRAARPDALIVSVSLKDRGAIFGGGRRPTASLWYDAGSDRMVTSSAFAETFPEWAKKWTSREAMSAIRASRWEPLDAEWIRAHAASPDAQPGEGNPPGFGAVFPHDPSQAKPPAMGIRLSPQTDQALIRLGLTALDAENARGRDTLLAVSFSTPDYVGHVFGPDSWEAWDELRRLDGALAQFFKELDTRFGPDGYAVVLAADHGTAPLPELKAEARPWCRAGAGPDPWERPCKGGERLLSDDLARELGAAAQKALGEGGWILGVADPYVVLTDKGRALIASTAAAEKARAAKLSEVIRKTLLAHPGVLSVRGKAEGIAAAGKGGDDELIANSISDDAGDYFIATRPGSFFDPLYTPGFGSSHGTTNLYDRTVPLLVRAPKRVPAGAVQTAPVPFGAFAHTLADLLGVPAPPAARNAPTLAEKAP